MPRRSRSDYAKLTFLFLVAFAGYLATSEQAVPDAQLRAIFGSFSLAGGLVLYQIDPTWKRTP